MKTYHKIICSFLVCGTIFFSSCSKWLDVKPQTSVKSDDLLSTEAGFKEALIGVYINMSDTKIYGKELSFGFIDVLARQYEIPSGQNYYNTQQYNYKATNTIGIKDAIWETQYNVIANINNILQNIDQKKAIMSPILNNIIKGEMLGLRAFIHLDLMRLYGYGDLMHRPQVMNKMAIPYITSFSMEYPPQRSYKETITLIENDLLEAMRYLKDDPNLTDESRDESYYDEVNTDGFLDKRDDRFNYWAAAATLARLYYWIGDYENALKYSDLVIKSKTWGWITQSSISNTDLPQRDMTFMNEHLFSLRTVKYADIVNNYIIPNTSNGSTSVNHMLYTTETKLKSLYEVSSSIGITDYRYVYQYNTADSKSFCQKLAQRDKANENYINRIPLIRISELYIIAIDAMLNGKTPNLPTAKEYFDVYRKARGIKIPIDQSISITDFNAELVKEMRKEFVAEGQLFYFYKRLNYAKLPGTTVDMNDKNYVIPYPDDEITYGNRVQ